MIRDLTAVTAFILTHKNGPGVKFLQQSYKQEQVCQLVTSEVEL